GGGSARGGAGVAGWLFRAAPPTGDLVIDGLAVTDPRQGTGRALIEAGALVAARDGRPGLRAEVRARNRGALAFYDRVGFPSAAKAAMACPGGGRSICCT
uniref:GNAT family N-acetyltransferase n=1 Tax=Paracoccus sp. PAMC 22219 TaxID=1569209 RepID=UPI0012E019C5